MVAVSLGVSPLSLRSENRYRLRFVIFKFYVSESNFLLLLLSSNDGILTLRAVLSVSLSKSSQLCQFHERSYWDMITMLRILNVVKVKVKAKAVENLLLCSGNHPMAELLVPVVNLVQT